MKTKKKSKTNHNEKLTRLDFWSLKTQFSYSLSTFFFFKKKKSKVNHNEKLTSTNTKTLTTQPHSVQIFTIQPFECKIISYKMRKGRKKKKNKSKNIDLGASRNSIWTNHIIYNQYLQNPSSKWASPSSACFCSLSF